MTGLITKILISWNLCLILCALLGYSRREAVGLLETATFVAIFMPSIRLSRR
jgi:hypothetical protein